MRFFLSLFLFLVVTVPLQAQDKLWSIGPFAKSQTVNTVTFGPSGPTFATNQHDSQTRSLFRSRRSIAVAGNRIVVAVQTGQIRGFRLFSLDIGTGQLLDTREFPDSGFTALFATKDGNIVVSSGEVQKLSASLKDISQYDPSASGHHYASIQNISTSGDVLGNATSPGFELIDTSTMKARALTAEPSVATSINGHGFITDNVHWIHEFPKDTNFVTYVDGTGQHLAYHGKCGGRPEFISETNILLPGCKHPLVIDTSGKLIRELSTLQPVEYASRAQNGQRFAIQHRTANAEAFLIYTMTSDKPIAEIRSDQSSDMYGQSWTAFSPDGSLFIIGSASGLSLYKLP